MEKTAKLKYSNAMRNIMIMAGGYQYQLAAIMSMWLGWQLAAGWRLA
jgi:hypothetical protein